MGKSQQEALREHAENMVAKLAAGEQGGLDSGGNEPPAKRQRTEAVSAAEAAGSFESGERGFTLLLELGARFVDTGGAEALLAAEGADALKGRLAALGIKASGAPLDRAKRVLMLQSVASLSEVPKSLLVKGITFVKAGTSSEDGTGNTSAVTQSAPGAPSAVPQASKTDESAAPP